MVTLKTETENMDKVACIQLTMIFAAVAFAVTARTWQALNVLVSTVGLCAFIAGGAFLLQREGLTWIELLHGNVPNEAALDVALSGAMYAGLIFYLVSFVVRGLVRSETQVTRNPAD